MRSTLLALAFRSALTIALSALATAQTTFSEVHPIFVNRCGQCHAVVGFGGFDIGNPNISAAYFDSQQASYWAPGQTKGFAAYQRILNGSMPPNGGCTGNPALDVGLPLCLSAAEQSLIGQWIADGQLGPLSSAGVNPEFDVRVMVQTGAAIAFINEVGLDDGGTVVLRGADGQGSGLFRASTAGQLERVTPPTSAVFEGLAVQAGLPSVALTRRRAGTNFTLESWPVAGGAGRVLASAPGEFDALSSVFDVASDGRIAFWAQVGSTQRLMVGYAPPFAVAYSSPSGSASMQAPALASDGRVVFRDNAGALLRADPASGALTLLAANAPGLALSPFPPQVAHNGEWALFGAERGFGPGVLAWSSAAQPGNLLHVAGERLEGVDPGAALTLRDVRSVADGTDKLTARAVYATTVGGLTGFYASSQRLRRDGDGTPYASGGALRKVIGIGDTLGSSVIAALSVQARFNDAGALVCTVALAGGPLAVLRATPRGGPNGPVQRVKLSVKRVRGPNGAFAPTWSEQRLRRALAAVNTLFQRENLSGLQFELAAPLLDLPDPGSALGTGSWFDVDPLQLGALENAAQAAPLQTGWATDAVNVYLVNSLGGLAGSSAFPPGHPCAGAVDELLMLAPPSLAPAASLDAFARTLAQQLANYFGVAATFASTCTGPDAFAACAFPFSTANGVVPGDGLRDTPFDPDANGAGDLLALDAFYAACPDARVLVRRNLTAAYPGELLRARLSAGQVRRMRAAASAERAHVIAP
ncbi:MAG: hypothetical protein JNN27_14075 [Planctomycetes bacterium]|nr:hypothetical protein [Planctomycetota bacterium]